MDKDQLISGLVRLLAGSGNGQGVVQRNGQARQGGGGNKGKEPTGVITLSLGGHDRIEARYWENPVKDTGLTSIGYTKPRVSENSKGKRDFKSFKMTQAFADIEATYRVCERALERDRNKLISLTEEERAAAQRVVSAFAGNFNSNAVEECSQIVNGHTDVAGLLKEIVSRA